MLMTMLLAAQTVPAAAPPGQNQPPATMVVAPAAMLIAAFDADGDGRTSRAELDAGLARSFAAADGEHRGTLGYIGFADWALRWLGDRNALPSPFEVDTSGDDRISLAELQAWFDGEFARLDRDHDGFVTRAECLTIRATTGDSGDRPGKHGKRDGTGDKGSPPPR